MAEKYRRGLVIIGLCILIYLNFLLFWIGYKNYRNPALGNFKVIGVTEEEGVFFLNLEKSHHAVEYVLNVTNQEDTKIYETKSSTEKIALNDITATYNDKLKFAVVAKNKNDQELTIDDYEYTWDKASFASDNNRYLNVTSGLTLNLKGYNPKDTYYLKLEYLNGIIYETKITSANIFIPPEILEGYAGKITAKLYTPKNTLVSSYNFYINTPIVGKIKITSPRDNFNTRWNDIKLKIEGGENATHFQVLLLEENNLINTLDIPKDTKEYTIPAEYFNESRNYQIIVEAKYLDYEELTEKSQINVFIGEKENTNPVYVSHNPNFIKKDTIITLASRTKDATIYFTLDGNDPTTSSKIYSNPIKITEDVTIKAFAVSPKRYDSAIQIYDFKITDKELVVYLSPSRQYLNFGVSSAGYTNEMQEMNKITDVVERVLKENGVKVYRNNTNGNINDWLAESNYVKSDLHLAIHSNASGKNVRGIEIYVDKETSKSYSIATHIYQNLFAIYPGKTIPFADRGVKYAKGTLGEANDAFISCGTLIEIAYHDNYEDAKWIVENREEIGNNIAQSILSYYN